MPLCLLFIDLQGILSDVDLVRGSYCAMRTLRTSSRLLLFLCLPLSGFSQNKRKIDSLEKTLLAVEAEKKALGDVPLLYDTLRVNIYHALSQEYLNSSPEKAIGYAQAQLDLSRTIGFKKGIAVAGTNLGIAWKNGGDYPRALEYFQDALTITEDIGYKKGQAVCHINIGNIYDKQGRYAEALREDSIALRLNMEIGDQNGIASCYNNIGIIFKNRGDYEEALKNYELCRQIRERTNNRSGLAMVYNNIGGVYVKQKKYKEALENYSASLKIKQEAGDVMGMGVSYNNIGMAYFLQGDYPKALEYETKGLELSKKVKAMDRIKDAYEILYMTDSAMGNYKGAFEHHRLYLQAKDSLFNIDKERKLTQLSMQYDFDKRQQADNLQRLGEQQVYNVQLKNQENLTYIGFAGLALVAFALFFVYRSYQKQRSAYALLKETQAQLVQQEKLASLGQLATGLAHEIRNPLNFINNFAQLSSEITGELEEAKDEQERRELTEALKQNLGKISHHGLRVEGIVRSILEHSSASSAEKEPVDINRACEEAVRQAQHNSSAMLPGFQYKVKTEFAPGLPPLRLMPQSINQMLQSMLVNALHSVHERAEKEDRPYKPQVTVSTMRAGQNILIRIRDNGTGISPEHLDKIFIPFFTTRPTGKGAGLGLSLCMDIAKAHGGKITVDSVRGEYAEFTVTLPVV